MCSSSLHWVPFQTCSRAGAAAGRPSLLPETCAACAAWLPAPPGCLRPGDRRTVLESWAWRRQPQQGSFSFAEGRRGCLSLLPLGWSRGRALLLTGGTWALCGGSRVCVFTGVLPATRRAGADQGEERVGEWVPAETNIAGRWAWLPPQHRDRIVANIHTCNLPYGHE